MLVIFIKETPGYLLNYYYLKIEYIIVLLFIHLASMDSVGLGKSIKCYQSI